MYRDRHHLSESEYQGGDGCRIAQQRRPHYVRIDWVRLTVGTAHVLPVPQNVSAANVIRVLLLLKLMGFERPPWPPPASLNGASRR